MLFFGPLLGKTTTPIGARSGDFTLTLFKQIVKSYPRSELSPSLTIIFATLLWLATDLQDSGVILHPLTAPQILW